MAALLACICLGAAAPAVAQTRTGAPDGSFSFTPPPGFVAIPPLELYLFENQGRQTPVTPEELAEFRRTHLGFQQPAEKWFTPPYLIIRMETDRKRTPQDLFMESVMAEKDSAAGAGSGGHRFLEKEHLPTRRLAYYKDVGFSPAQGKKMGMGIYTYLTARGFLRLAWFVAEEDMRAWEPLLHQSAMSVTLSPEAEYRPEKRP